MIAGAAAAGFVNGLAGFGTSLFSLGFWLLVLPPVEAVALAVATAVVTGLQGVWVVRHQMGAAMGRLMRILLPALLTLPLGVLALAHIEPWVLRVLIAFFMVLYGLFFLTRRALPNFTRPAKIVDVFVGALSGFLGGLAGLSGALPAMWFALRPWARHETRAVLQPFNVVILLGTAIILAFNGVYSWDVLKALGLALIVALPSAQIGIWVFGAISDVQFRWLLICLMFVAGLSLLFREFLY